jgi:capsular polysaccharide biosynthesis protein
LEGLDLIITADLKTHTVLAHVVHVLNLHLTPAQLTNAVTSMSLPPGWSARVANALVHVIIAEVPTMKHRQSLMLADPAVPIDLPVAPKTKTDIIVALVLGLLAGGGLASLEYLDAPVKTEVNVPSIDLPMCGVISVIPGARSPRQHPRTPPAPANGS